MKKSPKKKTIKKNSSKKNNLNTDLKETSSKENDLKENNSANRVDSSNLVRIKKGINYTFIIIFVLVIGYILYLNFLPFGYFDEVTLDVGSPNDTTGKFYIIDNVSLGPRQEINGEYFRVLNGTTNLVYKPVGVLRNASVSASIEGEGVYFIKAPTINEWEYEFLGKDFHNFEVIAPHTIYQQFTELGEEVNMVNNLEKPLGIMLTFTAELEQTVLSGDIVITQDAKKIILEHSSGKIEYILEDYSLGREKEVFLAYVNKEIYLFVNKEFIGKISGEINNLNTFIEFNPKFLVLQEASETISKVDGCYEFDGKTRLIWPETHDKFEEGPFTIYAEWVPTKRSNVQQIIGHFNWEIWQNSNNIEFRVGRMNESGGPFYSISYPIFEEHFGQKNSLVAIYSPAQNIEEDGYIELFVNDNYAGRVSISQDIIWKDYGSENLTLGWTPHNFRQSPFFEGNICSVNFNYSKVELEKLTSVDLTFVDEDIVISIVGKGKLSSIKIVVSD